MCDYHYDSNNNSEKNYVQGCNTVVNVVLNTVLMFYIGVKVCVYLMVNAQIKLFESRLHFTINWTGNTNQF